jgi:hypothetical protein
MINDPTTAPSWLIAHLVVFMFQELGHRFGAPLEDEARRFKVDRQLAQVSVTCFLFDLCVLADSAWIANGSGGVLKDDARRFKVDMQVHR